MYSDEQGKAWGLRCELICIRAFSPVNADTILKYSEEKQTQTSNGQGFPSL